MDVQQMILLTADEAALVTGETSPGHRLEPRRTSDGHFVLPARILEAPAHAEHIPYLLTKTRCDVSVSCGGETIIVKAYAPSAAEIAPRTYVPDPRGHPWIVPPAPEKGDWSEHGIVGPYQTAAGEVRGLALLPSDYATSKRTLRNLNGLKKAWASAMTTPTYAYTSAEISYFGEQFLGLAHDAYRFAARIARYFDPESPAV